MSITVCMDSVTTTAFNPPKIVYIEVTKAIIPIDIQMLIPKKFSKTTAPA